MRTGDPLAALRRTPGVVNTMPEATLRAVADHGRVPADSIRNSYAESHAVLARLEALGIDLDAALQRLEDEGVSRFDDAWTQLAAALSGVLGQPAGAG